MPMKALDDATMEQFLMLSNKKLEQEARTRWQGGQRERGRGHRDAVQEGAHTQLRLR